MSRCRSCGMPLNDSTRGTEAAIAALVEQGVPPLTATRLTSSITSLPRWS